MFLNILLLIHMIISFFQRKNALLAKFQSEFVVSFEFGEILEYIYNIVLIFFADLLDQSIVAFVIAVLHVLIITVDGWLEILEVSHLYKIT